MTPYYQADGITIYHGDCRDVLPRLTNPVDLIVTDPPYGRSWNSGQGRMGGIANDDGTLDVETAIRDACRLLRHHRHLYVFGKTNLANLTTAATTELIWDKGKFTAGDLENPWGTAHEYIQFGVWTPFPSQANSGGLAARLRRGSVIQVPRQNNGRGAFTHPTEKPVMLMRLLIESSSVIGETVFDPFMGAGAVLVAAQQEDRNAIGVELEERYCEIAAKRLAQRSLFAPDEAS